MHVFEALLEAGCGHGEPVFGQFDGTFSCLSGNAETADACPGGSLVVNEAGEYVGARTFIQESYGAFKDEWADSRSRGGSEYIRHWFPGYPAKHRRQEHLDVQKRKSAPPRWRIIRGRPEAASSSAEK